MSDNLPDSSSVALAKGEAGATSAADHIDIVFDGPPSHESGRFVEVEDAAGKSIKVGEWIERPDGLWALRLPALTAQLARAEAAIAWANNSLYGSHGFFLSTCGGPPDEHHLDTPIEALKARANEQWRRAEDAERKLRKAEAIIARIKHGEFR